MSGFKAAIEGYSLADDLIKEHRAYQGAREKYGDAVASDPGLFSAIQELELNRNRDARAERQTQIQERAADRADRQDTRAAATHGMETEGYETERDEQGLLNMINGLRQARDNEEDLGVAFDNLVDALPQFGVAEEDIPAMREELLANPAILDQYYEALTGGTVGEKPTASKGGGAGGKTPDRAEIESELLKFDDVFNRLDKLQDPERQDAARSILGVPTPGKATSGGFGQLGAFPSTDAADYVSDFEALIEGDVRAIAFETLKGGGQITEKESEFARDAMLRLKRNISYEKYTRELADFRIYMERLRDAAQRRLDGEKVPEVTYPTANSERGEPGDPNYARRDGSDTSTLYYGFIAPDTGMKFIGNANSDPGDPANWQSPGDTRRDNR